MYSMFFVSRRQALGYLLACSAVCVGCGSAEESSDVPVHPAEGIVRFKGQPIAGALVALHPRNGAKSVAPNPRATVQPDGKFQLTTYRQHDGAPEG